MDLQNIQEQLNTEFAKADVRVIFWFDDKVKCLIGGTPAFYAIENFCKTKNPYTCGLHYGYADIPKEWIDNIIRREWIEELCNSMV